MSPSFAAALQSVQCAGKITANQKQHISSDMETVPIEQSVGRVTYKKYNAPHNTPCHDTSAMDGFVVEAAATSQATGQHPVVLEVVGTLIPGMVPPLTIPESCDGVQSCLEIMTGARFPGKSTATGHLDSTVPVESTSIKKVYKGLEGNETSRTFVEIISPVSKGAHRRRAGADMQLGDIILDSGQRISASHILPLASVGFQYIDVLRKPRIGIWSTGHEYMSDADGCSVDINGPYLMAAARECGADVKFLGYLDDKLEQVRDKIKQAADSGKYDILISTGGVSRGKFDVIRDALDCLRATILFHGVDMRPGHPVLFASSVSLESPNVAFAGLPGNPGAAAVCFRFLVIPYIRQLENHSELKPTLARAKALRPDSQASRCNYGGSSAALEPSEEEEASIIFSGKPNCDYFIPGRLHAGNRAEMVVEMEQKPSPARVRPFITANCWVHVEPSQGVCCGSVVKCYSFV